MHILYICHYFWPEPCAPAARAVDMATVWAAAGHEVSVVTCFPNYPTGVIPPEFRGKWYACETVQGITVHRVWTYPTPNEGVIRRTLSHLFFTLAAILQTRGRLGRPDVVIASSPTLFSGIAGWWLSRRYRAPFVFEVRDLWPALIVELGVLRPGPILRLLEGLEMFLYREAAAIVLVAGSFREHLVRRGVDPNKLTVITNGVDPSRVAPRPRLNTFRREMGVEGKFVVEYAGAHGISQGLHILLDVAAELSSDPDVHFLFVGDGAAKEGLVREARERGLNNVTFAPAQPPDRMPEVYAAADVCLVPLRGLPLYRSHVPSKIFEIMAAGRPIVASVEGEAAGILRESGSALVVPPGDAGAIAAALRRIRSEPDLAAGMAARGRDFVTQRYHRRMLAQQYLDLLLSLTGGTGR